MVSAASQLPGVPVRASEDRLYFHMAIVAAVVAFAGFAPTYWLPLMAGTQVAPPIIHVHAVAFFGWVLFFVVQTWLAANRRIAKHRSMGMVAISLATAMVLLGILTSIERMYAAAAIGKTAAGLEFSIVPLGSIFLFAIIFAAAVMNVRRTDWHKRLMLVAAITILDAPIARWFLTFLAPADAPPGGPQDATGYRYWTMFVEDIQEVFNRCVAAGANVAIPVTQFSPEMTIAIVEDPDGNWVEFVQKG